jgi:hypothetical protein
MDAAVQMAPTHRFYKDGNKIDEYVGSSYPALEVGLPCRSYSSFSPRRPLLTESLLSVCSA